MSNYRNVSTQIHRQTHILLLLVKEIFCIGYTALHWAAKHGNNDLVKLIAGTFKAQVNVK